MSCEHGCQQEWGFEVFRYESTNKRPDDATPDGIAATNGHHTSDHERDHQAQRIVRAVHDEEALEGNNGKQGTNRVVDNGLPAEEGSRSRCHLGLPQQRHDDGRARDDEDRSQDERTWPGEPHHQTGGKRRHQPHQWATEEDQPSHGLRRFANARKVQRQPALEQNHRHRHRHNGPVDVAEVLGWIDVARDGAEHEAGDQQEHDRR